MGIKNKVLKLIPNNLEIIFRDYLRRKKSLKMYNSNQFENPVFQSSIAALDYYKCIFVHIPKNAGLSVSYTLFGNTGGSHRKIRDYQKLFSHNTFRRYYKFTFVRNPWDRVVSTYFFLKAGGLTEKDKAWAEINLYHFQNFNDFVRGWLNEENINNSLHFQRQHIFLEGENGKIAVDFIGRFENIEEDFKIITNKLKIKRTLTKTNDSIRKLNYRDYYNEETKAIVDNVYHRDIILFNYKF